MAVASVRPGSKTTWAVRAGKSISTNLTPSTPLIAAFTVTFRIRQRHSRTHGIAVTAEHTTINIYLDRFDFFAIYFCLGRLNSAKRAGCNCKRQFADT